MSVETKLLAAYCDQLVAYYQFHAMHINVTGRNFVGDHKLLGSIYEDSQGEIDKVGEILRTLEVKVPTTLSSIISLASISEIDTEYYTADEMLQLAYDTVEALIDCYQEVIEECGSDADCAHISNYFQDRVLKLKTFCWKLRVTLE
jgi:DNA-binding ferritin-like protein